MKVDLTGFDRAAALVVRRAEEALIAEYRAILMEIFWEILTQTPQFTGRAVAHWTVGVGAPEFFQDDGLGDFVNVLNGRHKKNGQFYKADMAHQRGDDKWIYYAWERNQHKFDLIHRRTPVYFTNAVSGDADGDWDEDEDYNYLDALQDSGYWMQKLRSVNKPYETAAATIIRVQAEAASLGPRAKGLITFRHKRRN